MFTLINMLSKQTPTDSFPSYKIVPEERQHREQIALKRISNVEAIGSTIRRLDYDIVNL